MTIFQPQGFLDATEFALSGTGETTAFSGDINGAWIDSLRVVNSTAGAINVTLSKHDGSTAYPLVSVHPLPAQGAINANGEATSVYLVKEPFFLKGGWTIKATGNTGITVHVNFLRPAGRSVT